MNIPKPLQSFLRAEIDPAFRQRAGLIFERIQLTKPRRVLDMGCGRGFYTHSLAFFPFIKKIHGVDVNQNYLEVAKKHCTDKRITLHNASIYSLPFPDDYFDCIVFSEVLEHLDNEKKALKELMRVLKKGGSVMITVPHGDFPFLWDPLNWILMKIFRTHVPEHIWWLAGIWADHKRLYRKTRLKDALSKNGFRTAEEPISIVHWSWPFAHFLLYGIGKNIVERLPGARSFSRFEFGKPRLLSTVLSFFMSIPSRLLDRRFPTHASVNLFVQVKK